MSTTFLDEDDLVSLTRRKQRAAQAKILRSMGIVFKIRPDASLAVLRAHIEAEFGAVPKAAPKARQLEPNWNAINVKKELP
jgi:hypothetical protein